MSLRVLVTAGATQVPIDRVRAITNVFTGRTGTQVAAAIAALPGTEVRLLTSAPHRTQEWGLPASVDVRGYTSFDELRDLMQASIAHERWPGAIVHSAAVSDYLVERVSDAAGHALDAGGKMVAVGIQARAHPHQAHGPVLVVCEVFFTRPHELDWLAHGHGHLHRLADEVQFRFAPQTPAEEGGVDDHLALGQAGQGHHQRQGRLG